jgi:hypothetical protein
LVSLKDVTLISSLPTSILIQSASINILFTFPFQVRLGVSDSCSYLLRSQFLAVILLSLRAICK